MTTPKQPKPDLVRFAERILENWPECDLDGSDIQNIAHECGVVELVVVTEPCGERCWCADYGCSFPAECYRLVDLRVPQEPPPNCFVCPDCGVVVGVDEDLCCRTCGADAIVIVDGKPLTGVPQGGEK